MGDGALCVEMVVGMAALNNNKEGSRDCINSEGVVNGEDRPLADCVGLEAISEDIRKKDISNEDINSEVLNPIISPKGNASSCIDITSQPSQVGGGDVNSESSRDLSLVETTSDETDTSCANTSTALEPLKSQVTLEIPEHVSTTGVRKITFKFTKKKEDYDQIPCVNNRQNYTSDRRLLNDDVTGSGRYLSVSSLGSSVRNVPVQTIPSNYPTNVKKLLVTGILNGAKVKYISRSQKRELDGIIDSGGYLCSCSSCNFSTVLSAYEFELHAGAKTKHPNNHIYLENGKPIYNIIQGLRTAPLVHLEEVIRNVAGSALNETAFHVWKGSLEQASGTCIPDRRRCSHLLISQSSDNGENSTPTSLSYPMEDSEGRPIPTLKRPYSFTAKSIVKQKKTSEHGSKRSRRDNDLHRLLFMPNGLPDGAELAYYARGQKLLAGYKQGGGIVCGCCDAEVSPSQFESHAGMAARRQPYRHIYTSNGLTLHDIALSLLNGQSIAAGVSDDMCSKCGSGGDLHLCNTCPRAFHKDCLDIPATNDATWQCPDCTQGINDGNRPRTIAIRSSRVVKTPEYEVGGCAICRSHDFTPLIFDERTVILCDQCEKEFHVGCLREKEICDLKEIPSNKWFCCSECKQIYEELEGIVSNGIQTISSSQINVVKSKHVEKGAVFDESASFRLHFLKGANHRADDLPLLSATTSIFRECFDPIVAVTGRDLIPVMVHGRNISGQEFGGMNCILLTVNAVVVSAGLLRIFGREVAELPLVATAQKHQGKGFFQALFGCIEQLLCSLKVENLVLPAAEEAESIWTKMFGFRRITEDRMIGYSKFQLTIFKGTSMLEKQITLPENTS